MSELDDIRYYTRARAEELREMAQDGRPWFFLCASAFIDYLARLTKGQIVGPKGYKEFIGKFMMGNIRNVHIYDEKILEGVSSVSPQGVINVTIGCHKSHQ